ncbi:MAG: hypothetical protein ACKVOW_00650 [Chitinophagaceae bacterium]
MERIQRIGTDQISFIGSISYIRVPFVFDSNMNGTDVTDIRDQISFIG